MKMGMYSTFIDQNIVVKNKRGLDKLQEEMDIDIVDDGKVDFGGWDESKLEGYWYQETLDVLWAIAPFIEGYAQFSYEEGYSFRIVFEDGKVYYQKAREVWDTKEELEKKSIF